MSYIVTGKREDLIAAINEARRFINAANSAVIAIDELENNKYHQASCKEVAAAKQSSMDLTRQLVFVRK